MPSLEEMNLPILSSLKKTCGRKSRRTLTFE
jgi:hypothetical protein